MADLDPLDRRARELLAAYRTHAGPSPAAVRRLHAVLRRSAAAEGLLPGRPDAPPRRSAPLWRTVAAVTLLAAAVLLAVQLVPDGLALRTDPPDHAAAALVGEAIPPGEVEARRPASSESGSAPSDSTHNRIDPEAAPSDSSRDRIDPEAALSDSTHDRADSGAEPTPSDSARNRADPGPQPPAHDEAPAPAHRRPAREAPRPPADAATRDPKTAPASPGDAQPADSALARELAFMRAVNRELQAGAPARALEMLADYSTRFPAGLLREESEALRAVALCTAHPERAREAAAAFLRAYPGSLSAGRVRRACGEP
ncbi:MAG TPA: hypothetical protein VIK91_11715 [Nannocystis sp.]